MSTVRLRAPCKINLFLEIHGRRPDGYHAIATVMETISLADELTVATAASLSVRTDRADVPDGPDNLAHRILVAARSQAGLALPVDVHIAKHLPPGSGLGAGSSDAAAALRGALRAYGRTLGLLEQRELCAAVGSDTAFFVTGGVALCTGRGEIITSVAAHGIRHYVVVLGGPPAPTKEVYEALRLDGPTRSEDAVVRALIDSGRVGPGLVFNRLESAAFARFPALELLGRQITAAAERQAHLSGSGSAFFLLCEDAVDARTLADRVCSRTQLDARPACSEPALTPDS